MQFSTIFFDVDGTLYAENTGLWQAIKERMNIYMVERMRLPADQIPILRERYYKEYGTTLRGLQTVHQVDAADFLNFVHDIPIEQYLSPDPELRKMIEALPGRKIIFTNAAANHARRVITARALDGCFDGMIDVLDVDPYCKPMPEAFHKALQLTGESNPRQCLMIDDLPRNTQTAKELGFFSILISPNGTSTQANATIESLHSLPEVLKLSP